MPVQPPTLVVNEIYACLQGESTFSGRPCVLVRLTGCHLRCKWCDSDYSFYEGDRIAVDSLIGKIQTYNLPLVLVTGGEPLLQKHTPYLLSQLCNRGFEVTLETSGNLPWHDVDPRVVAIVDVKCPGSGESSKNRLDLLAYLRPHDEVKFVVQDRTDYEYARDVIFKHLQGCSNPILISPVWNTLSLQDLTQWILDDRLPVRLQVQLHKIIYGSNRRGV